MSQYLDIGIGPCSACGTERRRYVELREGTTMALCFPCLLRAAKAETIRAELTPSELQRRENAKAQWEGYDRGAALLRQRAQQRQAQRQRRRERRAEGVCVDCGLEKTGGKRLGPKCAAKERSRQEVRNGLQRTAIRRWS